MVSDRPAMQATKVASGSGANTAMLEFAGITKDTPQPAWVNRKRSSELASQRVTLPKPLSRLFLAKYPYTRMRSGSAP
jgi:hypothetical protein